MSTIRVTCQHCDHTNTVPIVNVPTAIYCDVDSGGCDRQFLYSVKTIIHYSVEVYKVPKPAFVEKLERAAS